MVDDDPDSADVFAELLSSLGHEVRVASDGHDGLSIDASWEPHLVFLDLGLPTIDGYEVARKLRERRPDGRRIIAFSGFGQTADVERSRAAGCDQHLLKPATLEAIIQILEKPL